MPPSMAYRYGMSHKVWHTRMPYPRRDTKFDTRHPLGNSHWLYLAGEARIVCDTSSVEVLSG
jgi:hypothetical protein